MNRQTLISELLVDEALRLRVYDDATGEPLRPGYTLKGHASIGIGRALDAAHGISNAEAFYLVNNDIDAIAAELTAKLPWFSSLNDARQRVLFNIAFNAGVTGLLGFRDMLAAMQAGDFVKAAGCLLASKLANDAKARAARLVALLKT